MFTPSHLSKQSWPSGSGVEFFPALIDDECLRPVATLYYVVLLRDSRRTPVYREVSCSRILHTRSILLVRIVPPRNLLSILPLIDFCYKI